VQTTRIAAAAFGAAVCFGSAVLGRLDGEAGSRGAARQRAKGREEQREGAEGQRGRERRERLGKRQRAGEGRVGAGLLVSGAGGCGLASCIVNHELGWVWVGASPISRRTPRPSQRRAREKAWQVEERAGEQSPRGRTGPGLGVQTNSVAGHHVAAVRCRRRVLVVVGGRRGTGRQTDRAKRGAGGQETQAERTRPHCSLRPPA
jgi:hypothetical protein